MENTTLGIRQRPKSTIIHFVPPGKMDPQAKKAMNSHVTFENRRRQREQRQQALRGNPRPAQSPFLEDNICRCFVQALSTPVKLNNDLTDRPLSRIVQRRLGTSDSYKNCVSCGRPQFAARSQAGQLRIAKLHPGVAGLITFRFDPFYSLPDLSVDLSAEDIRRLDELKIDLITFFTPGELKTVLLPTATSNAAVLMALLYMISAFSSELKGNPHDRLASVLRKEAIQRINNNLKDRETAATSENISAIAFVSGGTWTFGSSLSYQEVAAYEGRIMELLAEGPTWNPPDAYGRTMLKILTTHIFVQSALTLKLLNSHLVSKFNTIPRPVSNHEDLAESPLFCPRAEFYSLRNARACSPDTLNILKATKALIDKFLIIKSTKLTAGDEIIESYEETKTYLSWLVSDPVARTRMQGDYKFEACRLPAKITNRAIETGMAFQNSDINTAQELKFAMQKTAIGEAWGPMSGVLYWVSLVGAALTPIGHLHHGYMDAALRRVMFELTYKTPVFESTIIATRRFHDLHKALASAA